MEEAYQGSNIATLEVVIEAAGLLMHSQAEGLGPTTIQEVVPPLVARISQPPNVEAVQPPMVVAS